jgi:serine/threonine protein kinase
VESLDTLVHVPTPPARELVLGRYRLLERLGAGGFGVVWRAHDELLHREVAVKRIPLPAGGGAVYERGAAAVRGASGAREAGERATREALASARLAHPAIVALYEACAVEDAFFLISELVHGDTLADLIAARALSDEQTLAIGLELTSALAHAHARGVFHRDVKPQNVLVSPLPGDPDGAAGAVKLTDFGGARLAGEDALTRTGDVLGTLAYMAPEQSEGRPAGAAADLYSLALVLHEGLCGVNPVRGPSPAATARRIGSRLPPLGRARPDLPRALTRALDRALLPEPAARGTLAELRLALEEGLERGLGRSQWSRGRVRGERERHAALIRPAPLPTHTVPGPHLSPEDPRAPKPHATGLPAPVGDPALTEDGPHEDQPAAAPAPRRLALPRKLWLACALAVVVWQAASGHPGVALLLLAALAPLAALPRRAGPGWLACALAPLLGVIGLAGAFPALAGQATRWRARAGLGALGYWWLLLAEPLLSGVSRARLWLGAPAGTPPHAVWEGSLTSAAAHVIAPLLTLAVLLGAALWAGGALLLPWIVRGRHAALDVVAATTWSAGLAATVPLLAASRLGGLSAPVAYAHAAPRGLALGAVLGGMLAVAARALRGPV